MKPLVPQRPPQGKAPREAKTTTPGSFARPADIGGAHSFSSPDTPGMPG